MLNQIWEGDLLDSFRLPTNPVVLGTFTLALRTYPLPFLATLMDAPARTAYMIVRSQDMPADQYLRLLARIVDHANATRPAGVSISAAQGIHSVLEADRRILRSQLRSAGSTLVLMGVVLGLLWRSIRLAVLSLLINVLPVAAVLALSAVFGVSLNSVTIMVAAVCLGIAVDDSVHFITHWRDERKQATDPATALRRTLDAKARPIICSSLVLIGVFLIFGLSSFPPVVDFGWMAAGSFLAALVAVLVGLPAWLCGSDRMTGTDPEPRSAEQ
jgi:predicted RND superfamily exporter protein